MNGHAEEVEEKEEVKPQEDKEATQAEPDSNARADTEVMRFPPRVSSASQHNS